MQLDALRRDDPELAGLLDAEFERQSRVIDLIASENLCPTSIREATASTLTDKYAEGYPGRRYYGGCEVADQVEKLAIDRGKTLFGCDHLNVQPHAGSPANMAVYFSVCKPGDTVLSMDLAHGGHLTHGMKANFSGKLYNIVHYGVDRESEVIDYAALAEQAAEVRPVLIIAGASSYPRAIDVERMAQIARDAGAKLLVDMAHFAGLVVTGHHPDPVLVADFVTCTTHKTLRGPRSGIAMCKAEHAKALDRMVFPGLQGGPLLHVIAAKATAFKLAAAPEFKTYQEQVCRNAKAMAEELASAGFRLVSGGTDTHLALVDVSAKGLSGGRAQDWLGRAGIIVNMNVIPFDDRSPRDPSGVRIGTPSITTRGADEEDARRIARWIAEVLTAADPEKEADGVRAHVTEWCAAHPIYD